jgi:alanyl-tRNA synthetase
MTERLYYRDSFLREFDAEVLDCQLAQGRWEVLLDRTAFYPTSGGQPHDLGRLGDAFVLDVLEREDEEIVHAVGHPIPPGRIHGSIDWPRRFDHMQQHTGQHLLSAAFLELFQFPTVSFHLGREISTIDVAAPSVVPRHLEEAERRVNVIICEDRPISLRFGTAQELAEAGIRKAVEREGILRAVEIEGFDRQPCGGTHLARTGQVGLLLVRKCEKQKQNWRIEFVTGFRALACARGDFAALTRVAEELSCGLPEVPAMVHKMLEDRRTTQRATKKLQEKLAELEAESLLAAKAQSCGDSARMISTVFEEGDPAYLGLLSTKLVAHPAVYALLAARTGGAIVFARSADLDADMGALLRQVLAPAGGKGGGTKQFAQGSVSDSAALDNILAAAAANLGR